MRPVADRCSRSQSQVFAFDCAKCQAKLGVKGEQVVARARQAVEQARAAKARKEARRASTLGRLSGSLRRPSLVRQQSGLESEASDCAFDLIVACGTCAHLHKLLVPKPKPHRQHSGRIHTLTSRTMAASDPIAGQRSWLSEVLESALQEDEMELLQ